MAFGELCFRSVCYAGAWVSGLLLAGIISVLLVLSWPAWYHLGVMRLWSDATWHPARSAAEGTFGVAVMLAGSWLVAVGALLWSVPVSLLTAVALQFHVGVAARGILLPLMRLLAQIPSVVYGLWGLTAIVPLVARVAPPGACWGVASLVLGMMLLPMMTLWFLAAFSQVPDELLRAATALGFSRQTMIWRIAIPTCRAALAASVVMALVRALGETMAVMMVAGNVPQWPRSVVDPIRTTTATIALEMGYADGLHRAVLFLCGLLLVLSTLIAVALVEKVVRRMAYH